MRCQLFYSVLLTTGGKNLSPGSGIPFAGTLHSSADPGFEIALTRHNELLDIDVRRCSPPGRRCRRLVRSICV